MVAKPIMHLAQRVVPKVVVLLTSRRSSGLPQNLKNYEGFRASSSPSVHIAASAPRAQFSRRMPLKIEAARVGGVEIPNQKRIEFSLQYIYGIGHTTAKAILSDTVMILISKNWNCCIFCFCS